MSYDHGLVARMADALTALGKRGVRQKNVFGGRGFLVGKSTFAIAWDDGLIVKCPTAEYARALAEPGVTPFAPDGEKPMSTWVVVAADAIADDPELADWLRRGLRAVR
jgi:TfoX/Sxy family transcriptional regulator of competence genes